MKDQIDFALDADDPATLSQVAMLVSPPFSQRLTTKTLQTQKSFLITDVRLRSKTRTDDSTLYGIDQWALDVYHKLAGYESQPGVTTQVVDGMAHTIYDRYDNRNLTPDTPTQKTIYVLSAREVDLLVHAGAYDDPTATEEKLRQQLVGQTWSMPDQVTVSESAVQIPQTTMVLGQNVNKYPTREFSLAAVHDTGQKVVINSHTPGSNLALVMNMALQELTPGVTPMVDVNKDLEMATAVQESSKDHQVESRILENELDLGVDANAIRQQQAELNQDSAKTPVKTQPNQVATSDADEYQQAVAQGAASQAGIKVAADPTQDQSAVSEDQALADEFLNDSQAPKLSVSSQAQNGQTKRRQRQQTIQHVESQADSASSVAAPESVTFNPEPNVAAPAAKMSVQTPAKPVMTVKPTPRSAEQLTASLASTGQESLTGNSAKSDLATTAEAIPDPSVDQLKALMESIQKSGITQNFVEPDYEAAAKSSPAAQRQKLRLKRKLANQERAQQQAASQAVLRQKHTDGPDL